ncbi:hypothetical protein F3S47_06915 [Histidinibacterium aquaticum]|uniref:DUF2214 domain-containing protein n=1 Tax=Histidinibacterium aquaticum TaxID=2613962 RepID=A0A5J5GPJ1_9RHOB|nr:hypothetical protein F3S47_06915 [Histidinibacterium aquaticum]
MAAWLEATAVAQHLKVSRWTYPLVNAGHILGLALLVGAVLPMDLRLLRGRDGTDLRRYAAAGLAMAVVFGFLLFATQAGDYLGNRAFLVKMALLALALVNIAAHLRLSALSPGRQRAAALASLLLWPAVLIAGRMIAYV